MEAAPTGGRRGGWSWGRAAITALAPGVVWALGYVPVPGVDPDAITEWSPSHGVLTEVGRVFRHGLMAYATAALIVEGVASLAPRWRSLRTSGDPGRAKLTFASIALCLVIAAGLGFSEARALAVDVDASVSKTFVTLSAVAATAWLLWLARLLGKRGLAHGMLSLLVSFGVVGQARAFARAAARRGGLSPVEIVVIAIAVVTVILVTTVAVRPPRAAPPRRDPGYREGLADSLPMAVPVPASSILVVAVARVVLGVLQGGARFVHASRLASYLESRVASSTIVVGVATALAVLFARRLTDPERIATLAAPAAGTLPVSRFEEAHRAARRAFAATIAYVVVLAVVGEIVLHLVGFPIAVLWIALATALVLDAIEELRARRALGPLVAAWSETRFSALEPARAALAAAGIEAHLRDRRSRSLLDVLGPWAPSEVLVRPADLERARTLLDEKLATNDVAEPDDDQDPEAHHTAPLAPPRNVAVGLALLVGATAFAPMLPAANTVPSRRPFAVAAVAPSSPVPHVSFHEVDDDGEDPFKAMYETRLYGVQRNAMPVGADDHAESGAQRYPGVRPELRHYLSFGFEPGETEVQATARAARALAALVIPPGDRLAFGPQPDYDAETDRHVTAGVRSYLLRAEPLLTEADLLDAVAVPGDEGGGTSVNIELTASGGARLATFTRSHMGRRLAIVIDDVVSSAPRVVSEIVGGNLPISMGATSDDEALDTALHLAATLRAAARGH